METRTGSYPHPVLGNGDDVESVFEVLNASFTPAVEDVRVNFRVRLDDDDMCSMLNQGKAALQVTWSCAATLSSGDLRPALVTKHADGETYEAWLDQRLIRDRVRIDIRIVAAEDMFAYRLSRQHPDYEAQAFQVRAGDILADGGSFEIAPGKMFDPLRPPLGSCFRIEADPRLPKQIDVDFSDDEQVVIRLSHDMAVGLNGLANLPEIQLSLVVLPALMETLAFIERTEADEQAEDLSAKGWYRTVKELGARGMEDATLVAKAQRILQFPLAVSLNTPLVREEEADE